MTPPTGQAKVTDADLEWWEAWHAALPVLQRPDSLAMATARLAAIVPRLIAALRTERAVVAEAEADLTESLETRRQLLVWKEAAEARIADLTAEVERLRATRERVEWVNCWTNEHGEQFVLLGDLLAALDGPQ